jgi:FkbM family methyltransferase
MLLPNKKALAAALARRRLRQMRRKVWDLPANSIVPCNQFKVKINDGPNFYILYKDVFAERIYHFQSERPDPVILDCGTNIGMSVLYFKQVYPAARIIGFEPDPTVYPLLEHNIKANALGNVRIEQAALGGQVGTLTFWSDGVCGSCADQYRPGDVKEGLTRFDVPCVRLRDYLQEPVDFMKMNIEGAEFEAIADAKDRLRQIREMIIEYHHLPNLRRSLHEILAILHEAGFEYLINDFDRETNPGCGAPFRLTPSSRYYLLIYAKRID